MSIIPIERVDELLDERERRARCRCGGFGWIDVPPSYVDRMMREKPVHSRSSHENSVYPCPLHRPELFERWSGGHLDSDHDVWSCDQCRAREVPRARTRRRLVREIPRAPLPYKDADE